MPSTPTDRLSGLTTSVAVKAPCRLKTTGNHALSGLAAVDGVTPAAGDRILVGSNTNAIENGIYNASATAWTRAKDFDGTYDAVGGTQVLVISGGTNGNTYWRVDGEGGVAIGVDAINFTPGLIDDSASATFRQSGSSVTSTVQAELRNIINARSFGVLADGEADDTDAMQDAIEEVRVAGGVLILPPGRIPVSDELFDYTWFNGLTYPPYVIRGAGMNGTVFVNQCVSKSPFNLGNSYFAELSDFGIEGNGVVGSLGNSHAISLIDPDFEVDTYKPGHMVLRRLYITNHKGNAGNYLDDPMLACCVYAANALGLKIDGVFASGSSLGYYFYKCYQPSVLFTTVYNNLYSGLIADQCERLSCSDSDFVVNDSLSAGSVTLHNDTTMRSGSFCAFASHGTILRDSKLKSHHYSGASVKASFFPCIESNWFANDALDGPVSLYATSGVRARGNTFDRFGPFPSGTRRDIHMVMGDGYNNIGEIEGNFFRHGGGGVTTAFIEIDGTGTAGAAMHGRIANNFMGGEDALTNASHVTDGLKISGIAGSIQVEGNTVTAPTSALFDTAFNFAGTEGPGLSFMHNPIVKPGGPATVTTEVSGLTAPFSTDGNTVDSATMRYRRPALLGSKTFDWADLATATQQSTTVTVTGAAAGMKAEAWMNVALSGTRLWAEVTAADTVTVYQRNDTGGNINVASGTLYAQVELRPF